MILTRFSATGLRNLAEFTLEPSPSLNIFVGPNGGGKTSLLEGLYLLAMGRSFRAHPLTHVINHEMSELQIMGVLSSFAPHPQNDLTSESPVPPPVIPTALSRSRENQTRFKINGEWVSSVAEIARCLPLQFMHIDSYQLLQAPSLARRQLMDWGLFHVEQDFFFSMEAIPTSIKAKKCRIKTRYFI